MATQTRTPTGASRPADYPTAAPATRNPVSTANLAGHPLHPILVTLPIGLFVGVLLLDIVYWRGANPAFFTAGLWLLGAGLVGAALAAVTGVTDVLGDRRVRALREVWWHAGGNVLMVLVQLFSFWRRYRY